MNRFKSATVNLDAMLRLGLLVLCITFFPAGLAQAQSSGASNEAQLDAIDLKEYVGSYGPRKILFANGMLQYNNEGMPMPVSLTSTGIDSFKVDIPAGAQVRGPAGGGAIPTFVFLRDEEGRITTLSLVNPDGTILGSAERTSSDSQ